MNEQIREFEKQCWSHYVNGVLIDGHLHFDAQKFAELIVKETMQVVANQLPSNQYLDVAHAVIEHYKDADVI